MPPPRLVIVAPRFWPLVDEASVAASRLAQGVAAAGCDVLVVTARWKASWPERMVLGDVPVLRLPGAPRGGWATLRWLYGLRRWWRTSGLTSADALLISGLRLEAYALLAAGARRAGPRVVLWAGEHDLTWQRTAPLGSRIAARCRAAPRIVAESAALAAELAAAGYPRDRLRVLPRQARPLAGLGDRDQARAALAAVNADLVTAPGAPVALAIGRLDAEHRAGDLVRAWRIVTARWPDARLWIIGDGPDRERLYRQIGDLDQRFRVLIPGTFDTWEELLAAADLFLMPALHTVPPWALLDALAAGLPTIAAAGQAACDAIESETTGLLYPAGDAAALASAVLRLLADPALAARLGAAVRLRYQQKADPSEQARAWLQALEMR
jgi:glycosyltransferase involved in cell wall biosynthesis